DGEAASSGGDPLRLARLEKVRLIEDREARHLGQLEVAENLLGGRDVITHARIAHIDDVEQQIGVLRLFEGGTECREELFGQVPNETHRVGDDHLPLTWETDATRASVERREELVLCENVRIREHVQQRALARVRVADDRDDRNAAAGASRAALLALL